MRLTEKYSDYNKFLTENAINNAARSEEAYDFYKYYFTDEPLKGHSNVGTEPSIELLYNAKQEKASDSDDDGSDSEDSNREDHPMNEYPDSDKASDEDENDNFEEIAEKKYKQSVATVLDKFIRKKANYAGNQALIQKSAEGEEREYVGEIEDVDIGDEEDGN